MQLKNTSPPSSFHVEEDRAMHSVFRWNQWNRKLKWYTGQVSRCEAMATNSSYPAMKLLRINGGVCLFICPFICCQAGANVAVSEWRPPPQDSASQEWSSEAGPVSEAARALISFSPLPKRIQGPLLKWRRMAKSPSHNNDKITCNARNTAPVLPKPFKGIKATNW